MVILTPSCRGGRGADLKRRKSHGNFVLPNTRVLHRLELLVTVLAMNVAMLAMCLAPVV